MNTKFLIKLEGLPKLSFAHTFHADRYENTLSSRDHKQAFLEVTYVAEGELILRYEDGSRVHATPHSVICNLFSQSVSILAPRRHSHHTVGFVFPYSPAQEDQEDALCIPLHLPFREQSKSEELIDRIIATHTVHTKGELACTGLFLQLLEELDRQSKQSASVSPPRHRLYMKKAKEYIFTHLHEKIRQREIAEHLGISPEYLCNVFKEAEGVPLMQFVNRVKLEQIRLTVEKNRLSLAQASERYGYSDPNYVSRLHKKMFHFNISDFKSAAHVPKE